MFEKYGFVLNVPPSVAGMDDLHYVAYDIEKPGRLVIIRKLGAGEQALNDIAMNKILGGHTNIIRYREVFLRDRYIYIITEYPFTSMGQLTNIDIKELRSLMVQCLWVLVYLEDMKVSHGALSPNSIYLVANGMQKRLVYGGMKVTGARVVLSNFRSARIEHGEGGCDADRRAMANAFEWLLSKRRVSGLGEEDTATVQTIIAIMRDPKKSLSVALGSGFFDIYRTTSSCTYESTEGLGGSSSANLRGSKKDGYSWKEAM